MQVYDFSWHHVTGGEISRERFPESERGTNLEAKVSRLARDEALRAHCVQTGETRWFVHGGEVETPAWVAGHE